MAFGPFALNQGYNNAAQVYLGFNDRTGYLAGMKNAPTGSNLPTPAVLARYGAFNQGGVPQTPFLRAFAVRFGLRYGMAAFQDITRVQTTQDPNLPTWPYGNNTSFS